MTKIMHVFLCVVVVVSVFFYAPMDVEASEDFTFSGTIKPNTTSLSYYMSNASGLNLGSFAIDETLFDDKYYSVSFDGILDGTLSSSVRLRNYYVVLSVGDTNYIVNYAINPGTTSPVTQFSSTGSYVIYGLGSELKKIGLEFYGICYVVDTSDITFNVDYELRNVVFTEISGDEYGDFESAYNDGYNMGFTDGEESGYGNGYSNGFADGEASVDTGAIYDEAFQAGKDSVDTQSYYDAGYRAGYQVAYSDGYESGYDSGYQDAMDRIANWGADTSEYPILVYNSTVNDITLMCEVNTNRPQVAYGDEFLAQLDFDVNPNHTYKIVFDSSVPSGEWVDFSGSQDEQINYNLGNFSVPWYFGRTFTFVQGANLSSNIRLECYIYASHFYDTDGNFNNSSFLPWGGASYEYFDYIKIYVYDYGPSGDTQNHIANQTDQLTNGYDSSQGAAMNEDFKASVNDYQTAEDSLFTSAQTSLDNFTFLDFTSITGMVTALSFVSSIMTRIYNAMGGDTGAAGIILSVLFSIMLVSMAIGLYRFYVSNGKSDNSNKGGD